MKYNYLLMVFCTFIFFGCASNKKLGGLNGSEDLLTSKWQIIEISGVQIKGKVNDRTPYLNFSKEDKHYSIITGCNTLNGTYDLSGNKLNFNNGISTMMFCNDMSVEDGFKSILTTIKSYEIIGELLNLKGDKGTLVVLKKMKSSEGSISLKGSWELSFIAGSTVDFKQLFPDQKPSLILSDDGKVSGNSSCNTYNTTYTISENNSLQFGNIMSTKMMCGNIQGEQLYLSTLSKVNKYSCNGKTLNLMVDDIVVMTFTKK